MSTPNQYMVLLRNTDWDEGLPVDEVIQVVDQYHLWMDRMITEGKLLGGQPLMAGGRIVRKQGDIISDGPFIESKEAIGGYLLVQADSFEQAAEMVKTFPPVQRGVQIEIRELTTVCPISQRLEKRLATA